MKILAIETSCDDTGVAILEKTAKGQKILADFVSSQIEIHAPWGGVVPTLAKREHQKNIVPLFKEALAKAGLLTKQKSISQTSQKIKTVKKILEKENDLTAKLIPFLHKYEKPKIDALAVTVGPGLEPALWVGINFVRALAYFWQMPILPVNHIAGHIAAALNSAPTKKIFPALALVVSGGHTQLILISKPNAYKIIGETRDDAAGEAFDKVAKMLGLGYPGGPIISQIAKNYKPKTRDFSLPRPMIKSGNFDFSFSGLKTAVLYTLQKMTPAQIKKATPAIAAEFQQAVIDVLTAKTIAAAKQFKTKTIILAGGVAANQALREHLKKTINQELPNSLFLTPPAALCTDNAAMIALASLNKKAVLWTSIKAEANLTI